MANDLYRTYEVLIEESIHDDHPKRAKTSKDSRFKPEIDAALRDTHTIFQDAVCYNILCFAGLAGNEPPPGSERGRDFLNPLWKHLTTPAKEGGIQEETGRVIRRLATHYAPLKALDRDGVTADDFVNLVYSAPLQIRADMTPEEQAKARERRMTCYLLLEDDARNKKTGVLNCEGMAPFAKTWTGLLCVGKKASIPSELPYARFSAEVGEKIAEKNDDDELKRILDEAIEKYRVAAQAETERDLEKQFEQEVSRLQQRIAGAEALPEADTKRETKISTARKELEQFQSAKQNWMQERWADIRKKLPEDVKAATKQRFLKQTTATSLRLTEGEFGKVKAAAESAVPVIAKFFRFREPPVGRKSNREAALFRYLLLRDHADSVVRSAAIREYCAFIKKDAPAKTSGSSGKGAKRMPFQPEASYAFRFFGKQCLGLDGRSKAASSPSRDLDVTAFQAAAEDVFKYKIRSDERKKRVRRLLNVVEAYENNGATLAAEYSPSGKKLTVRGMAGDLRWSCEEENRKGIVQLLKGLSGDKEIVSYGLREGTIGGWAEVRKMFLRRYRQCAGRPKREQALPDWLERGVDKEQTANRQGFGSADFFHALCDPACFHLWLPGTDGEKKHGVKDFIPHYVGYCEWREELISLLLKEDGTELERGAELSSTELAKLARRPIRFTWPGLLNRHKKPSYRYYDFTAELAPKFPMQLFRRVRPKDDPTRVEGYKLIPAKEAVLTLAARRLKRDKILNKNGETGEWSSVDALWCPPLILEGEPTPTAATKPVAGKEKQKATDPAEASFSLIAAPLPGDYWNTVAIVPSATEKEPVHLTVSIKIERDEIAKLQNEGVFFVRKSAKGTEEEDDKRKFLRWPIDIETDKQAAKERAAQEKREAKSTGKPKEKKSAREPDVTPSKLWCAYDGGFLVKQSHFSPEADTKRVPDFHILSIDLGNRFAAAFTRLRIHADPNGEGREISYQHNPVIKAELFGAPGKLCLQGEGAETWQLITEKNKQHIARKMKAKKIDREPIVGTYELVDEPFGNGGRGRFPTDEEYEEFLKLAGRLVPLESLPPAGKEQTYPELGDHLAFRLKRRIGRLRTLFNLAWRLCGKYERDNRTGKHDMPRTEQDQYFHHRMTVETLARSMFPKRPRQEGEQEEPGDLSLRATLAPDEQWQRLKDANPLDSLKGAAETKRRADLEAKLKDGGAWNWDALAEDVKKQIREYMEGVPGDAEHPPLHELLAAVVEFCLPLKGRRWRWDNNPSGERLSWTAPGSSPDWNPNVMGMRGLSMKRLEQILNLRQRCQSFAKLEDRYHGVPPRAGVLGYKGFKGGNYDPQDSSRDERPDCCTKLLERSNRIREQRVDQTAHLILTEALGMELKNPAEVANKKERKAEVDLHGEYKRRLDKNGNPYPRCSVIVLENLERYRTSQERTKSENSRLMKWAHRAIIEKLEDMCRPFGITLMLVDPAFSSHFDSRNGLPGVRVEEVSPGFEHTYPYKRWAEGRTKSGGDTQLAKDIKGLAKLFADNPDYKGNLLLAVEGGKLFCPVQPPAGDGEGLLNADINAAGNIGLRGVADPQRWDIFPRLRTKQISDSEVSVTNWRGWFGKFPQETKEKQSEGRRMKAQGMEASAASTATADSEGNNADSESSQSSEYPPFFVEISDFPSLSEGDWLIKEAYGYEHDGVKFRAFPQGVYLKRVEQLCHDRIQKINTERLQA